MDVGKCVAVVRIGEGKESMGGNDTYDLRNMLDEGLLAEVRGLSGGAEVVALKKHPHTVSAHMALEALRNYVDGNGA
jgi:hypothetical protein